eukprot:g3129.t1
MISRPANQPKNGTLTSTLGAAGFYAKMTNGVATFIGLKIDIAGFPYALRFSVDHPIFDTNGQANYIDQVKMTVGVGKAVVVEVARHPSFVIAGKTFNFSTAPVLNLLDSGGNLLVEDFTSTIEVSIHINPSAGRLDVSNLTACTMYDGAYANCNQKPGCIYDSALQKCKGFRLTVPVYAGVAQFDGMLIDKVGPLYQLKYTATADPLFPNPYQWTGSIFNLSPSFNVLLGVPKSLKLLQAASDAWAGGTPFQNQPIVALLDGGENIVVTDSTNIVTATLYINPTGYPLLGVKTAKYDLGIATFQNLAIEKHGEGYGIKYTTSVDPTFEVSQFVAVRYATEFQLSSNDKQPNDRFGFSNDIQLVDDVNSSLKDMAVVGAPYEDRALDEIQVVQTEGTSSIYVSEVQTVSSSAWHRNEIQVIQTIGIPKTSLLRKPVVGYGDNIPMFKLRWRNVTTRLMEADVSATQLAIIMQEDLKSVDVGWIDATRSPNVDCGCEGGYNWKITFRTPLGGTFRLSFREDVKRHLTYGQWATTTSPIQWNASASDMKAALEALQSISEVNVERRDMNFAGGFSWTIVFNKVAGLDSSVYPFIDDLDLKQYSFLEDTVGNLAPLVANETMLTGTDATVRVHEVFSTSDLSDEDNLNIKDTTSPSLHLDVERRARKGNHGRRAGAAYVFTRVEERWPQEFKLLGHDTDSYDQFGTSVSVSVDTVAVGAPGAENYGQASKKSLECSASKGYFTLSYQGQTTAPFDASTCTLSDLLQGLSAISSLGRVVAVNSDNEIDSTVMPLLFCNESAPTTFTIRISSPNIKESLTSIQQLTANVAPLYFPKLDTATEASPGSIKIVDVQLAQGLDNFQTGAVYTFKRNANGAWNEETKIMPSGGQPGDEFGGKVILRGDTLVATALEDDRDGDGAGAVYHFYKSDGSWKELQKLGFLDHECGLGCYYSTQKYQGLQFGYSLALQGNTLIVGGYPKTKKLRELNQGEVYVYKRNSPGGNFLPEQIISDVSSHIGDAFGYTLSIHENTLVGAKCLWLPSSGKVTQPAAYDPLGLSDYAPHYGALNYPKNDSQIQVEVIITDDHVYESPNEMFNVRLLAPGFQPSYGGNLWSDVTVEDDGDGGIGAETYFDLFESSPGAIGHQKFGYSVSAVGSSARKPTPGMYRPELIEDSGDVILAVGMPYAGAAVGNMTHSKVGEVHMYEKTESTGMWTKVQVVTCPTGYNQSNIFFGTSVSLHNKTMVVGTPGLSCAFVYRYNTNSSKWLMEEKLSWSELDTMDRYGDRNAVAVWNNWIVVGAKGAEAVFIYKFNGTSWVRWQRIRQDYNETVILRTAYRNHKDYGAAVAMWSDTLLVGAPKADHSHQTYADDYATKNSFSSNTNDGGGRPTEKGFHGRGIVYQYLINVTSGMWELQTELQAKDKQAQDNFGSSIAIDQDYLVIGAPNEDMKARSTWDFETGNLVGWHKTGDAFDYQPTLGDNTMGRDVYGHTVMAGEDTTYYTRKQYTGEGTRMYQTSGGVADSVRDPAGEAEYTYTESIRLPTFAYKGNPSQRSGKRGKYWIGTYEKRHDNNTAIGNVQGDIPTGTLTSDPFMIGGTEISFLVGGGCRINEVWVELFVDGESGYFPNYKSPLLGGFDTGTAAIPVYRVTGKCTETMHRVTWNVGEWIGKIGQIRIVDMSTMLWAHINVDDFQFDWDNNPATNGGAGNIEPCSHGQCGHHYGESSGAAYVYRRVSKARTEDINGLTVPELCQQFCDSNGCFFNGYSEGWGGEVQDIDRWQCYWYEEQKFQASDKRENDMFGNDVAIDFGAGIVLVGAPGGRIVDLFNRNSRSGRLQTDWAHTGGFTPNTEKTNFPSNPNNPKVGRIMGFRADDQPWRSGSIYLFTRWPESRAGDGRLTEASKWNVTEKLKTQSPAKLDRDHLGFSVALVGYEAFAGAPKEPATYSEVYKQVGSVAYFNLRIDLVRFRKQKWVIQEFSNENDPNFIDVYIDRIGDLSKSLSLKYATSDITATGTPPADYEICMKYYKSERGECGDYVEQSGTITWGPGQKDSAIRLFAIDDFCPEAFQEVFKLSLFLPGGDVLVGKEYTAYVVIEDDDEIAARAKNKAYCKRQASPVYSAIEN